MHNKKKYNSKIKMENFTINTTLKNKPTFKKKLWLEIKNEILGKKYNLSLVFIGDKKSRFLNKKFRNKDYSANILSFPVDSDMGEIFINFPASKKDSKKWKRDYKNFIDFLFIHGLSHLKGHDHKNDFDAEIMEKFEVKNRKKFGI